MSAESQHSTRSSDPSFSSSRILRLNLIRPIVLFAAGLSVAFTGAFHADLGFDRLLMGGILGVLALMQIFDWRVSAAHTRAPLSLIAVGIAASVIAAVLQFVATTPLMFAIVIAAWGVVTGVSELIASRTLPSQRGDRRFLGVIALLMAVLIGVFANDAIAVIGFFGAYAVIAGVFIGISIFDANSKKKIEPLPFDGSSAETEVVGSEDSASVDITSLTHRTESTA